MNQSLHLLSTANFLQNAVSKVSQENLLYLYARYKQATCGSANPDDRPGIFDMKGRKKFDAWHKLDGVYRAEAMSQYIGKIVELNIGWTPDQADDSLQSSSGGFGLRPSRMKAGNSSENSEDVDQETSDEEKLLNAVKEGDEISVKEILDAQPELIHIKDNNVMTLLHWASDMGIHPIVQILIEKGIGVNERDSEGQTALHYAASCAHPEVVQLLLDNNADPTISDNEEKTPLDIAEDEQILEIFERHMSHI
uniref:Acyl-CoA-binding domain-containing protein 6 n=1 Tax=Acrobeloides nanus TaxID=290746 RepID=A0A914BXQ7_9BILA